ncbi:hypothetical protein [Rhodococcus sp. NPDC049939]|uniref:hypothetical protein n=1 Tax=Rhodococcus sp. NPDC049939 TaxID=3155511 RepID=UPI0033EC5242
MFSDDDRRLLRELHQRIRTGWPQLGTNDKGEPLTLVDALADLCKHLLDGGAK